MSDEADENSFALADNQPLLGISVSRGRVFKPSYKAAQPPPTPLQEIAKGTFEVAQRMKLAEATMCEKLDELNSRRSRFINFEPELFLSLADCFWCRSGSTLTLTHIRGGQEGVPSLSISILPQQVTFADAVLHHSVRGGISNETALKAALHLARSEGCNDHPNEQANKKDSK